MQKYSNNMFHYSRFDTCEVKIGEIGLGGNNPIRIQSMTTTDTMDTDESIAQSIRMIEAGAELVRLTAPSIKEAENLKCIKKGIRDLGFSTPIIADIHFTPNAALIAAEIVEKVRINPGNYADRKQFQKIEYTDQSYTEELERIRERFLPLIRICKTNGTALRIGTNHGSLSDRILSRYGDTPLGMVESALEFTRMCIDENFHNIVFSMKASNTHIMIQAYRLLVSKMMGNGMNYPLHLGVTEAGEGEDGRIKSSVGIGTLLADGLGDTIRVSLTEEPENELPVARLLVNRFDSLKSNIRGDSTKIILPYDPFFHQRRESKTILNIGGSQVPVVMSDLSKIPNISYETLNKIGLQYNSTIDKWTLSDTVPDYLYLGEQTISIDLPDTIGIIQDKNHAGNHKYIYPMFNSISDLNASFHPDLNFLKINSDCNLTGLADLSIPTVLVIQTGSEQILIKLREIGIKLMKYNLQIPIIYSIDSSELTPDELQCYLSTDFGGLFIDGFGDGIMTFGDKRIKHINQTLFGLLQAARVRISKTEYISCPSCGRTLFDLQSVTANIRERTSHLKGVKIGIMGCIVNGPGEMADADYGYVGTGKEKISLYKGQDIIKANLQSGEAVDSLIQLIKDNGDWVDPPS
ncbi:MAG: (E)-4-hydroxy-3-methylbut-2-enyl-diphosphate synthase [Candidatus Marinimicrobia bacterium]|nr:(E)-4-hydroxy-3-methylbut-2-enyl-diphosphate synthase [Candidatus Neomarinimicrobiota bacterium]